MKKIVFLLFICLNLFAKEVYDLRNEVVNAQIKLSTYEKLSDDILLGFAKEHLREEYAKLSKIKDLVDRDDKKNELIQKARTMVIKPQIGDELISGSTNVAVKYIKGKIVAEMNDDSMLKEQASNQFIDNVIIAFEPTTREVLKEIVNKGEITYEIVGTITKFQDYYFCLKDIKIKIFDEKNKQIDIKELISGVPNGYDVKMEYK